MSQNLNDLLFMTEPEYVSETSTITRTGRERTLQCIDITGSEDYAPEITAPKVVNILKDITAAVSSIILDFTELSLTLKEVIARNLKDLGALVLNLEIRYNSKLGLYALAFLDCNARQALEYWLKIIDRVQGLKVPVFVTWTGKVDLTPEEMGIYVGKALARMNVFLETKKRFDIIQVLNKEWGV